MSRAATAGSRRMSSYRMPLPNPQLPCKGGDWSLDICAVFLEQKLPSLANEGWLRPLRKSGEASLAGADGVVRSSHQLLEVERTTPFLMFRPTGLTLRAAPPKERDHLLDGASTPPLPRSIQSCPAGQRQNTQETAPSKTKDLSAQFLERGVWTYLLPASAGRGRNAKFEMYVQVY